MSFETIQTEMQNRLPDNNQGLISPADVREPLLALMVALIALNARVTALEDDDDDDDD